jgi:hypothetical protein
MSEPKIYLKSSAKRVTTQYGELLRVGFKADDMIAFCREHANERGYVNLNISERREESKFGDTHSVSLDAWKKSSGQSAPITTTRQAVGDDFDHSDVPF